MTRDYVSYSIHAEATLVLNAVNPIMVQGAALTDFTMLSGFPADITGAIPNGTTVEIDPSAERPFVRLLGTATAA